MVYAELKRERERERDVLVREPSAGTHVVKTITSKITLFFLLFVRAIMVGVGWRRVLCNGAEELRLRLAQSRSKNNLVVSELNKMSRFFQS